MSPGRLKVAAIVYEFPSTSETFVLSQLRGLSQQGCEVSIFADSPDQGAPESYTGEFGSVNYFGLPLKSLRESYGRFRGSRAADTPHRGSARKPGLLSRALGRVRLGMEARVFSRHDAFDAVCAHFGPNGVRAVRLRERAALRGPIVTSFYGYDIGRRWRQEGYAELFEKGDLFIALSDHMRSRLIKFGCSSDRLVVHRLGVDLSKFHPASPPKKRPLEILTVARLVEKKGIEYALRAVATLESRKVNVRYTVVGDGPLRGKLEGLIDSLALADNVRLTGALPHGEIAELMRASDVLLAPSVTAQDGDVEGTPVAILEAAASGMAVVASSHEGIPETVDDGVSGFLVAERDSAAIAASLEQLAHDRQLRVSMGAAGRAIVADRHDIDVLNREYMTLLERVASEYRLA